MKGKRKQYGLKHHLTSTVHGSMGDNLHKIVMEISLDNNEYRLWDKDQEVVLLSRTRKGSDIIFVGNKQRLLAASSPTGPAFEGAQISSGQRAAPGAIERIRIDKNT